MLLVHYSGILYLTLLEETVQTYQSLVGARNSNLRPLSPRTEIKGDNRKAGETFTIFKLLFKANYGLYMYMFRVLMSYWWHR